MKSRIYERVRQLRGEEACARLGEMFMGTIHGFCLRLLEDHFGYGDHNVLNENQEMAFIMREGWGLGLRGNGNYAQNCSDFIRSVNVVYDELIDRKELTKKAADFFGRSRNMNSCWTVISSLPSVEWCILPWRICANGLPPSRE